MRKIDYSGIKFNRIKVIKEVGYKYVGNRKRGVWLCQCDCGNYIKLSSDIIAKRKQISCGCSKKDVRKKCDYKFGEDYVIGFDSKNRTFFVDKKDYDIIKNYCWRVSTNGAVQATIRNNTVAMHRFIFGEEVIGKVVDHINHNRADNRRKNLRIVTQKENSKNRIVSKNNTSGRTGVTYDNIKNKYKASIKVDGKYIFGGYFKELDEAIKRREELEELYFGEYRNKYL